MTAPATPQLEDGYTRVANELLEALARIRVPGEARQVLDVIIRKTYGFNKKSDQIATSQFVEATGLIRQNVTRAVRTLEELNLVFVSSNGPSSPATFRINKDHSTWRPESKKIRGTRIKKDSPGESNTIPGESNLMPHGESKKIQERIKKDSDPNQKRFAGESNLMPTKDSERKERQKEITTTTTAAMTVREISILYNRYAGANIVSGGQITVLQDFVKKYTRDAIEEAFGAAAAINIESRFFLNWCKSRMERRQVAEVQQAKEQEQQQAKIRRHAEITVGSMWQSTATERVIIVRQVYDAFVEVEDLVGNELPSILKSQLADVTAWNRWEQAQ